jgi:hypothetical protein
MALGASGSGKTVLCKCVMEEAGRNGVPLIIVDPQGDIASLALRGDADKIRKHGTPLPIQEEFFGKIRPAIFTPASSKGIPICVNPLKFPPKDTSHEESILSLDVTTSSLAGFLGYDLGSDSGKAAKAYLFTVLKHLWHKEERINDIAHMADVVQNPPSEIRGALFDLVTKREPHEIARKLRFLTVGAPSLMFQMGVQIDMDMFMDRSDGKVPINIIYLNTLNSANDKQFFLAILLKELYYWMLKNPSEELQLLFYVDEIAPYIPPYPRNPPVKEVYALLFKQARKYGIGLVAATQNVTDIDYKALAQVNTWCLGRMMTKQDIARVRKIIESIDPARASMVLQQLPSLQTGEFLMLSPDFYEDVVDFQVRWLVTDHQTLDEKDLHKCVLPESRTFFKKYLLQEKKDAGETSDSPSSSWNFREVILEFLNSSRKAVSADVIAENLKVDVKNVKSKLRELLKAEIIERGHEQGSSGYLYWLKEFGFIPSKNIVEEVLAFPVKITQVEASERVKSLLEGGFFSKNEEIYDAEFQQIPVWRVLMAQETRRFLFKKNKFSAYYVSAQTGAVMSLDRKKIIFNKVLTKKADELKDLDNDENLTFIPKLPGEIESFPKIKMGKNKIYRKLKLTLGGEPLSAKMTLLPVWVLKVKHKKKSKKRRIIIDAASGRILSGPFSTI